MSDAPRERSEFLPWTENFSVRFDHGAVSDAQRKLSELVPWTAHGTLPSGYSECKVIESEARQKIPQLIEDGQCQ